MILSNNMHFEMRWHLWIPGMRLSNWVCIILFCAKPITIIKCKIGQIWIYCIFYRISVQLIRSPKKSKRIRKKFLKPTLAKCYRSIRLLYCPLNIQYHLFTYIFYKVKYRIGQEDSPKDFQATHTSLWSKSPPTVARSQQTM